MQKALAETPKIEAIEVKTPELVLDTPEQIKSFIAEILERHRLPESYLGIPSCESGFVPQQSWHLMKDGTREPSFGVWQINLPAHPDITKEQAMDVVWSTEWSIKQLKQGKAKIWSCYSS